MQTRLADFIRDTPEGREAESILRKCVHCGFCTATCPSYQVLGDDLDSPRGRIYLMKRALEGAPVSAKTRLHLDRCLTYRACETTCPTGVRYGRLLDIGRCLVEERVPRGVVEAAQRNALKAVIPDPALFRPLLKLGQLARPLLPGGLKRKVPARSAPAGPWPAPVHARRMLVLEGCAQPGLAPAINAAAIPAAGNSAIEPIATKATPSAMRIERSMLPTLQFMVHPLCMPNSENRWC